MPTPIVCFDFDGTLVDSRGRIHPRDREILATEQHVIFIPATGRPFLPVRYVFERNGLFIGQPIPFPLVLQNGAAIYRAGEILEAWYPFAPDVQAALIDAMLRHSQVTSWLFGLAEVHSLWPSPVAARMARRFDLDIQPFTPASRDQRFCKAMCIAEAPEPLQTVAAEIAGLGLEQSYSLPAVLEVNRAGIDKGRALATVLSMLGSDGTEVIAAGDGENDLPLFDLAALTFAPDTAPPAVCARADHIIDVSETGLLGPILQAMGLR